MQGFPVSLERYLEDNTIKGAEPVVPVRVAKEAAELVSRGEMDVTKPSWMG